MDNSQVNFNILLNIPSSKDMGILFHTISYSTKLTTPYLERELKELIDLNLVIKSCFSLLYKRTPSGDQVLEHELNKSYM